MKTKSILAGGLMLFAALVALVWFATSATDDTPEPITANSTLALDAAVTNAARAQAHYERAIREEPDNVDNYVGLAQVYLQQSQATGDETRYVPLAKDVLAQALERSPKHYPARALQAQLYNVLHQFEKGRDLANELIAEQPNHAYTYGILVDALVELGEYDAAVGASDKMNAIRPGLPAYARAAYLRELHGDGDGAKVAMRLAADAGVTGRDDRAWAIYQLGQLYLGDDNIDAAEIIFDALLDERPGYAHALSGLAQVEMARGNVDGAEALLNNAYEATPNPGFLEQLAEVHAVRGDADREADVLAAVEASLKAADAMGENVRMEYADFLADQERDLDQAVAWAEAEYARRPNHMHTQETMAWTLHKAGRTAEALPIIEKLLVQSPEDGKLYYRAAQIYDAAGQADQAAVYFQRALDGNVHIESPSAARDINRRLSVAAL
ncbi:MAG: hypothetical protein RhofKO_26460 [Rhodothermales bacterium]